MTCAPYHRRKSGVALIEVLVTLLILMLGLLGLAGVSSRANMTELESFQRIRALQLAQDMASRLDANRKVASCYSNGQTGVELGTGKGNTGVPACTTGSDQEKAQVAADLTSWDNQIKGEAETLGTDKVGAMIGAIGCITLDNPANNTYLIAVSWQGLVATVAPTIDGESGAEPFPCGHGAYGDDDRLHRVVTTKVQIGDLS